MAQVLRAKTILFRRLQASVGTVWSQLNLTMNQLKALHVIAHARPLPVSGLAEVLGMGRPAATLLVNALVRKGLVTRSEDPADRRRTLLGLSTRGRGLMEQLSQGSGQLLAQWLGRLSDEDLANLAAGLQALVAASSQDPVVWEHPGDRLP